MTFLSTTMTFMANHWKIFRSSSRIIVVLIRVLANTSLCHSLGVLVIGSIWQFSCTWRNITNLWRKIHKLMKKFSTIKGRAYLHTFAHLEPRLRQDTRWSCTFIMVLRYVKFILLFGKFQTADITRLGILPLMLSPMDSVR